MPSTALDKGLLSTIAYFDQLLRRGDPVAAAGKTNVA
jgi:hypothetical protein